MKQHLDEATPLRSIALMKQHPLDATPWWRNALMMKQHHSWWSNLLMKQRYNEAELWWSIALMKQHPDEATHWWSNVLMKQWPDEAMSWWSNVLIKKCTDEATHWWIKKTWPMCAWQGRNENQLIHKALIFGSIWKLYFICCSINLPNACSHLRILCQLCVQKRSLMFLLE